jgi:hypothetical protein
MGNGGVSIFSVPVSYFLFSEGVNLSERKIN